MNADVNGDGYADVIVAAWAAGPNATGHAFVYLGGPSGLSTNYATEMIGPDGQNGRFGSEVSAGDFNADGYGDVVVASFGTNGNGKAFVYLGGPMGTPSMPSATFDGGDLAVFTSRTADINGDGYSDFILGGIVGGTDRVDVYLGSAIGLSTTKASSTTLPGSTRGHTMWWVASPGDANGEDSRTSSSALSTEDTRPSTSSTGLLWGCLGYPQRRWLFRTVPTVG